MYIRILNTKSHNQSSLFSLQLKNIGRSKLRKKYNVVHMLPGVSGKHASLFNKV
jgi:hypothetical protein